MTPLKILEIRTSLSLRVAWTEFVEVFEVDGLLGMGEVLVEEAIDVVVLHDGVLEVGAVLQMTGLPVVVCAEGLSTEQLLALWRAGVADLSDPGNAETVCRSHQVVEGDPLDSLLSDEGSWLLHADLIEREKLATLGQLATGMAHSINNPAAWVVTNLNELQLSVVELKALLETSLTLSREHAPADRVEELEAQAEASYYPQNLQDMKDMLTESLEGMRRIRDIVGDLKGFQRADEDEWMPLDINQALKTAVEMARSQMAGAVQIEMSLQDCPPVNASPGRLAQAFLNILLNGIQAYAKNPSSNDVVTVSTSTDSGRVRVLVQDWGAGIPEEQQSRIFDPFFTMREHQGHSGLGLAICRDILQRHGGEIQVTSSVDEGTRVEVQLPVPTQFQQEIEENEEPELVTENLPRILLVDDEAPMTRAIRRVLKGLGEITVAHTAKEALEQIESQPPALILCDLSLPDEAGSALFERVKGSHPELGSCFLFLTGGAKNPEAEEFLEKHAEIVIFKPFESPELRDRVEQALN